MTSQSQKKVGDGRLPCRTHCNSRSKRRACSYMMATFCFTDCGFCSDHCLNSKVSLLMATRPAYIISTGPGDKCSQSQSFPEPRHKNKESARFGFSKSQESEIVTGHTGSCLASLRKRATIRKNPIIKLIHYRIEPMHFKDQTQYD